MRVFSNLTLLNKAEFRCILLVFTFIGILFIHFISLHFKIIITHQNMKITNKGVKNTVKRLNYFPLYLARGFTHFYLFQPNWCGTCSSLNVIYSFICDVIITFLFEYNQVLQLESNREHALLFLSNTLVPSHLNIS